MHVKHVIEYVLKILSENATIIRTHKIKHHIPLNIFNKKKNIYLTKIISYNLYRIKISYFKLARAPRSDISIILVIFYDFLINDL